MNTEIINNEAIDAAEEIVTTSSGVKDAVIFGFGVACGIAAVKVTKKAVNWIKKRKEDKAIDKAIDSEFEDEPGDNE